MPGHTRNASLLLTLLDTTTITTALTASTTTPVTDLAAMESVSILANFTYGSSGTKVIVWVQTSLDGGSTWCDVACMTFTTASGKKICSLKAATAVAASYAQTDGTLSDDTIKDGILGDQLRLKITTTGTYATNTTLKVTAVAKG
jgi:hypothetical protein